MNPFIGMRKIALKLSFGEMSIQVYHDAGMRITFSGKSLNPFNLHQKLKVLIPVYGRQMGFTAVLMLLLNKYQPLKPTDNFEYLHPLDIGGFNKSESVFA